MANKFANGFYKLLNPEKYIGKKAPHYRSSWEYSFMRFCDTNPSIINWASESIRIPYINPFTNRSTTYVPDFFITYVNKNGDKLAELIEIKPRTQTTFEAAGKSKRNQGAAILNSHKWAAAHAWCQSNGINFRILTEMDLFHQGKSR